MDSLIGRKFWVIGASSGLGRASAVALVHHGAEVVVSARRQPELEATVAEAGGGHVVTIDVLDEADIARATEETIGHLGGLDGILYTAGMSPLRALADLTASDWQRVFGVNTVGPSLVIAAALPHLSEDAIVGVVGSDSSLQPRHSLVAYGASKRALEAMLEGWRTEVLGGRRFVTIVLGPTQPTEFADDFPPEAFGDLIPHWQRQGFSQGVMNADEVAEGLCATYGAMFAAPTFGIQTMLLRAPEPDMAAGDFGISETTEG